MGLICATIAGAIMGWIFRDHALRTAKQDAFFWRRAYLDAINDFRAEQARDRHKRPNIGTYLGGL